MGMIAEVESGERSLSMRPLLPYEESAAQPRTTR